MSRASFLLFTSFAFLAPACGTDVTEAEQASGTTGTGGTTTTTTTTGAGGSTTTTTTTTGAGGATPAFCGGKAGIPCASDEWCQFDPPGSCGNDDGGGTCQPKPPGCLPDCPGVCGCDGKFHCNACGAQASGVDVSDSLACQSPDTYRAIALFTGAPRFALLKASPTRNLCFRLTVQGWLEPGIGISGDGYSVEQGEVTHDASDCDLMPGPLPPPIGASHPVSGGDGLLSMQMSPAQCIAGIHAKLLFSGQPPWAPQGEPLDADGLLLEGGCP